VGKDKSVGAKLKVVQIVSHEVALACTSFNFAEALENISCRFRISVFLCRVSRVTYNVRQLCEGGTTQSAERLFSFLF